MSLRVGVLAVQGAVSEHAEALHAAADRLGIEVDVTAVRNKTDLANVQGLVMPGGESTTISRLLRSTDMEDVVIQRAKDGDLALFGTCAGMILLADRASHDVDDKDIHLLGLLDASVDRNAFGRQKESFEAILDVEGIGAMPGVFIRAPAYDDIGAGVTVLARFNDRIVAAAQGHVLAAAFHPELTPDVRLHAHFLGLVQGVAARSSP